MSTGGHPEPSKLGSVNNPCAISPHNEVEGLWLVLCVTHDHRIRALALALEEM